MTKRNGNHVQPRAESHLQAQTVNVQLSLELDALHEDKEEQTCAVCREKVRIQRRTAEY